MRELRVTFNLRHSPDQNLSMSFMHLVDDESDVEALAEEDAAIVGSYSTGFARYWEGK